LAQEQMAASFGAPSARRATVKENLIAQPEQQEMKGIIEPQVIIDETYMCKFCMRLITEQEKEANEMSMF